MTYTRAGALDVIEPTVGGTGIRLHLNDPNSLGTFTTVNNAAAGLPTSGWTMGFGIGDAEGDGDLDLYQALEGTSKFILNNGDGTFTTAPAGAPVPQTTDTTNVAKFVDLDRDGDMDIYLGLGSSDKLYIRTHCMSGARLPSLSFACAQCPIASRRSAGADKCFECSAHEQRDATGKCAQCASGLDRHLGVAQCTECSPGYATRGKGVGCAACSPGFAAPDNGTIACTVCGGGTYANGLANTECINAPPGSYAGIGAAEPKPCAVGRYGSTSGRVDDQCTGACDEGHYCAPGSTVKNPPSCSIGYYLEMHLNVTTNATTPVCNKCDPSLMNCSIPGITLTNMPIKPGGWRLGGASARIIRCFSTSGACAGNLGILTPVMDASNASSNVTARRLNGVDPSTIETFGDALCTAGHTGVLCGQCMEGWNGYSDATLCSECEVGNIATSLIPLIVLLVLGLLVLATLSLRGGINLETVMDGGVAAAMEEVAIEKVDSAKEELDAKVNEAEEAAAKGQQSTGCKSLVLRFIGKAQKFGTKFKILVSLWQILQGMGSVFAIPFPPFYESVTGAVGGMIQVPSLVPIDGTS